MNAVPQDAPSERPDHESLGLAERIDHAFDRLEDIRGRPVVAVAAVVVVVGLIVGAWLLGRPGTPRPVEDLIPQVTLQTTLPAATAPAELVVHVSGAVRTPGVYVLAETARVVDAVNAAGGALPDADLHQLNLAALVADGMQVRVPLQGEQLPPLETPGQEVSGPVDLNRADTSQLEALPGVGPATAAAIVGFREKNGPFRTVEDLLDVPGIGPSKLAGLSELVIVR